MTAGSIAVPTVVPLRPPIPGRPKSCIDSNTKIELRTESNGATIHYTINGTKPNPFQRIGDRCTMKYHGPFTLPAGKQTVKALALSSDGMRESNVVTKLFDVSYMPPPTMSIEDDDMGFQDDLEQSRAHNDVLRAKTKLLTTPGSAWTDIEEMKSTQQRLADMHVKGRERHKPHAGTRFLETRRSETNEQQQYQPTYPSSSVQQPYIFNGIGSQDLTWATQRLPPPVSYDQPPEIHFDPRQYPRPSDFLNFTTTSKGLYPGPNQWMPVQVSPSGFVVPAPNGLKGVNDDLKLGKKITHDEATQTVGLYYPSERQMSRQKEQEEDKEAFEKQMRDRRPLLTAVSPGKGYWRKQVEHICQHLKAHTQNDAEFRALIGEPKMGKLLTSSIQEDGYELSLTLTFALRGGKDPFVGKQLGVKRSEGYLSAHTKIDERIDSDEESEEEVMSKSGGTRKVRKPKAKKKVASKLSPVDASLFKQLSAKKDTSVSEIQQLLDEGADPNCLNKNDLPPLIVAVRNSHVDAVEVLVQGGAEVNGHGPSSIKGNTALHEAVSLGPSGMKVIDALLFNGADQNMKNERGETPLDLAVKSGFESITKRFTSALGQAHLDRMTKARVKGY